MPVALVATVGEETKSLSDTRLQYTREAHRDSPEEKILGNEGRPAGQEQEGQVQSEGRLMFHAEGEKGQVSTVLRAGLGFCQGVSAMFATMSSFQS